MSTGEGRSVEVDTELLSIDLVGAAGGHAWVRERERNLLVAFDLETGRESFRHEGARRVHVLDHVVLSEDGGVVTAIDPRAGTPRRVGDRPARDVLGATAAHLWCTQAHADTVQGLDLARGAPTSAIRLDAAPLPGIATAASEIAFRLRDGSVVVLAAEGETARVARVIDVAREPRDAILPPIAAPSGLLVPVVEATARGPRTRLLSLATGDLAARAEANLAAQIVQASGALVAMSDGARTIVVAGARQIELPGAIIALRDPHVITRRGDTCFFAVLTNDAAARVALPAVPGATDAVLGPRTIAWRVGSRLVLLDLASIPLVDGAAVDLAIESQHRVESAEITFVSPRGIISMVSPRFGKLSALVPGTTGLKKGDRVALRSPPDGRTVRDFQPIAPGADAVVVTRRSLSIAGSPFEPAPATRDIDPAQILAALHARLAAWGISASIPAALDRLVRAHRAPHFAARLADAIGIVVIEPRERDGRVAVATTPTRHVTFELVPHEGTLAVVAWSRRTQGALLEAMTFEGFVAARLARRRGTAASSVATVAAEIGVSPAESSPSSRWAPPALLDHLLPMRRAPDHAALEARLGLPMGPTLRRLVEMAYRVYPEAPSDAFAAASLYLDWIDPIGPSAESMRFEGLTPHEIKPFAMTRGDWHHMGFLLDGTDRPADERPVVFVAKDSPPAHVVAPDLPSFLGLVARGGAEWIERDREPTRAAPDEEPAPARVLDESDAPAATRTPGWRAPTFHDASRCLEMIVGVARPTRWFDVTEAAPDRTFTYDE